MMLRMKSKVLISVLLVALLLSVSVFAIDEQAPEVPENKGHPKLGSVLYELTQAEDYNDFAQTRGLYVVDNKVRVILGLVNPEYNLPSDFGIEERRASDSYGNYLQALVQIDKLLELADDPNIQFIITPVVPNPLGILDVSKGTSNYVIYLGGIGIIIILFLIYYFWKKRK